MRYAYQLELHEILIRTNSLVGKYSSRFLNWPRQPVYEKQAQRQVFWLKIETGYWTQILKAIFQTEKQNRL